MHFLLAFLLSTVTGVVNFNSSAGLSNAYVNDIAIDSSGYIWLATNSGVSRFDGTVFRNFNTYNSPLCNEMVVCLLYDEQYDRLYIGTGDGLDVMDCGTFEISNIPEIDATVTSLEFGQNGILAGNRYGSLYYLERHSLEVEEFKEGHFKNLPNSYLSLCDMGSYLAVGHIAEGFSTVDYESAAVRRFVNDPSDPHSLPGNKVYALCKDSSSRLWVGTNKGLALFNPEMGNFTVFHYDSDDDTSIISDHIFSITELSDGKLWIGSDIGGVSILDLSQIRYGNDKPIKFTNIEATSNEYGLTSKNLRSIIEDGFGNVWVANHGEGLDCIPQKDAGRFHTIQYIESELSTKGKSFSSLFYDESGKLWAGTDNEVVVFEGSRIIRRYKLAPYIRRSNAQVYTMLPDGRYLYLGLYDDGLLRLDTLSGMAEKIDIGSDVDVNCLWKDDDGSIWVGTKTGVVHLSASEDRKIMEITEDLVGISTFGFTRDADGGLWMACYGRGLFHYPNGSGTPSIYDGTTGFGTIVHQITKEDNGIWVPSKGGIYHIPNLGYPSNFVKYDYYDGMEDAYVHALCPDDMGNIWFSTDVGISVLDPATREIRNFDRKDGVPRANFIDGTWAKSPTDGTIAFGSHAGLCFFNPSEILIKSTTSSIRVIESNVPVNSGNIDLKFIKRNLQLRFGVSNLAQCTKVEYLYKISCFKEDWEEVKGGDLLDFKQLPPGQHKLTVIARMRGGELNESNPYSINIKVQYPLPLKWYFILIYLALAALSVNALVRWSRRRYQLKADLEIEKQKNINQKRLSDEKQLFFTSMTHELRTPLSLIIGPLQDLASETGLPESVTYRLNLIRKNSARLMELVDNLLEVRKTESFNRELSITPVNLSELVYETGIQFGELSTGSSVKFRMDVSTDDRVVLLDRDAVQIILNNLLSNAMKYTSEGEVSLKLDWSSDVAAISISDTGCGIPEDSLDKIFDYMYRVESDSKPHGTGVGLALVKSLVELTGSRISVESHEGVGSVFTLYIDAEPVADSGESEMPPEESKKVMMVVEDSSDIKDYLVSSFNNDYFVLCASNGKEAFRQAQEYMPDIIISDVMMPLMNGYELVKAIRDDESLSHIPIILLTAKDGIEDKRLAYESGADSFISKPFTIPLLNSRINNILERREKMLGKIAELSSRGLPLQQFTAGKNYSRANIEFINELTKVVLEHLSDSSLDLTYLQNHFHSSHSSLYRRVRSLTGLSVTEFIRKIRLNQSLKMLSEEGYNVSETAYACGFNDISYFISCFKKEFGTTPSKYFDQ